MKLVAFLLLFTVPLSAQSYDFTITNDPAVCAPFCDSVVGSGSMSVSSQFTQTTLGSGYPILSLSGMLNGKPMSLANPVCCGPVNMFQSVTIPVPSFAPLWFSTSPHASTLWNVSLLDVHHVGTGQYLTGGGTMTAVAFDVTPAPVTTTIGHGKKPIFVGTYSGGSLAVAGPQLLAVAAARRSNRLNVELGIGIPAATAVTWLIIHEIRARRRR